MCSFLLDTIKEKAICTAYIDGSPYPATDFRIVPKHTYFQIIVPTESLFSITPRESVIHITSEGLEIKFSAKEVLRMITHASSEKESFITIELEEKI